jgi:hypothetical protein
MLPLKPLYINYLNYYYVINMVDIASFINYYYVIGESKLITLWVHSFSCSVPEGARVAPSGLCVSPKVIHESLSPAVVKWLLADLPKWRDEADVRTALRC